MTVAKNWHEGRPSGWSNGPQCVPWRSRRSAIIDYHDNIIVPELERRGGNHRSPVISYRDLPRSERGYKFFRTVTWDQILRDTRHLFEKWNNDTTIVEDARNRRVKTRVIIPAGHNYELTWSIFLRAISHVFDIEKDDTVRLEEKAKELRMDLQLDPPLLGE